MRRPSRWSVCKKVEPRHSGPRPLRFGKGTKSTRGCPRSSPRFFQALPLLILTLLPAIAQSRTFVLKHDGTGDVPTFQAGVDSLLAPREAREYPIPTDGSPSTVVSGEEVSPQLGSGWAVGTSG